MNTQMLLVGALGNKHFLPMRRRITMRSRSVLSSAEPYNRHTIRAEVKCDYIRGLVRNGRKHAKTENETGEIAHRVGVTHMY